MINSLNTLPFWLAALYLPHVKFHALQEGLKNFSTIDALFHAAPDTLHQNGFSHKQITSIKQPCWAHVEQDLKWAEKDNHHILPFDSSDYPKQLKDIHDPPPVLFVQGNKMLLKEAQLAMIGSRHPTHYGIKHAKQFANTLASLGWIISSGFAQGIDAASHEGALTSVEGRTIAIMGTGLNHCYPKHHHALAQAILKGKGALVSEFPLNTTPKPENFPRRNRLISGMSLGVVIIEARLKSGSLITARHALDQGREVFALPGAIDNPLASGCHWLIRQGAKLVENINDILEEFESLGFTQHRTRYIDSEKTNASTHKINEEKNEPHEKILSYIQGEVTSIDTLMIQSGLTAGEVSSILLTLELQNDIEAVIGGYRRIYKHV